MAEAKNSFIKSKMNKDLDARLLPNGEYREGINIQVSKSEGADVGALENVLGNQELVDLKAKSGCNCNLTTIGLYTDEVNNNIYIFLTDFNETLLDGYNFQSFNYSPSANNYIYLYNTSSRETIELVSGAFLNFSTTHPITSVNLLEGILFWTDNRNQPRRINVQSAVDFSPNYYTSEDQISVATYAPFQPIELYHRRNGAFIVNPEDSSTFSWNDNVVPVWYNGGSAVVVDDPLGVANKAGQNKILLAADNRFGLAQELDVEKTLVGSLVTAADASGLPISPDPIPANTALQSFSNGNEIALIDRTALPGSENPVNLTQDIAPGSIIYFNQNLNPITLGALGTDNWVTSMEDASSPMNPGGSYNSGYPGLTTNPNYNPKFNGDPDFLEDKFVRFSYRFKYEDGNYSIMAPFTQPTFIPKQDGYFLGATTPVSMTTDEQATYRSTVVGFMENKVNNIFLQIPLPLDKDNNGIQASSLGSELKISEIEILYKESDSLAVQVVDAIPKDGEQGFNRFGTATIIEYNYQGDKPYKTLPENELVRVFDKVPVKAHSQEIISNRLVYSNFQDKHTPPDSLDYNVAVSDKYDVFRADDPTVPRPIERTVSREYPMHTVKQNRNYQVGVVLADRYGRSSTTILSSVSTQAIGENDLTLLGDTIYFPYNNVSSTDKTKNLIQKWRGDSIKVLFNKPIDEERPPNSTTGWPGLYNGDPTDENYNPLGWYSYKIVVKQTEQEYYNVYLPSIMNFYPNLTAAQQSTDAPDPVNTVSFITLLNDNINKVPRDLTEVGPEQKQFRSSVQLYGRVAPHANATPTYNYQFNPVNAATRIAIPDTVSTISDQNDMFDNTSNVKYGSIYQTVSNPLLARISIASNAIGTESKTSETDAQTIWLGVYETDPVESLIDIYWETSSSGTIAELNEAIKTGTSGIKNFTTDDPADIQNKKWTFNLAEDISPSDYCTATYSSGVYTELRFYPYTEDASGVRAAVISSDIDLNSGFWVINGSGNDVTDKFVLEKYAGNGVNTPDKYSIKIASNTFFYYSPNSYIEDSFTFNFNVTNNDSGNQKGISTQIALTEKLLNIAPSITCPQDGIVVEPGASPVFSFEGVNGSNDNARNQEDLTWSITSQDPLEPDNGIPELIIDPTTGVVTDPTGTLNTPVNLTIALRDAGTLETTMASSGGPGGDPVGTCAPGVTGNTGYETTALNANFGSTKNMCINEASESSGFYWANPSTGNTSPVTTSPLPGYDDNMREPVSGLDLGTTLPNSKLASVSTCSGWSWKNTNRNPQVTMNGTNSGLGTDVVQGRSDCATNVIPVPEGLTDGSAYIILDFELGNYDSQGNDRPAVIWPTYLQYRENTNSAWQNATDIEGNEIKFGGAQANTYYRSESGISYGGSGFVQPSGFPLTGVKDKLSSAITSEGTAGPDKTDCFESWLESKENQGNWPLVSIGRKLFVVGKNQAYREPSGNAPSNAPDRFGEYRLITRYPYGNNISPTNSTSVTNPKIPTLDTFNCPSGPYEGYQNAKAYQKVYLSFGDFYNPTQLESRYSNGVGSNVTPPASFEYRINTNPADTKEEAAGFYPSEKVFAREWSFKYVSQFYHDPELTLPWSPGATNKWFAYRGKVNGEGTLNVDWGNEYASTRFGAPIYTCSTCPGGGANTIIGSGDNSKNSSVPVRPRDMKWVAQFDNLGKKIIQTAEPCVGDIDQNTGGNNTQCNKPAQAYQFGVLQPIRVDGNTLKILQTQSGITNSSFCNLQNLWSKITNGAPLSQGSRQIQTVGELNFHSSNPCYDKVGGATVTGGTATYTQGDPDGQFITITGNSVSVSPIPAGTPMNNYLIQDIGLTPC